MNTYILLDKTFYGVDLLGIFDSRIKAEDARLKFLDLPRESQLQQQAEWRYPILEIPINTLVEEMLYAE